MRLNDIEKSEWTKFKAQDGQITFVTEASDKPVDCPVCKTPISNQPKILTEVDKDGDVALWKFKCSYCKVNFVIFND